MYRALSPLVFWAVQLVCGVFVFFVHPKFGSVTLLAYSASVILLLYYFSGKKRFVVPSAPFLQATLLLHSTALFLPLASPTVTIRPLWDGFIQSLAVNPYMIAPAEVGPGISANFSFYSYVANVFSASPFSPIQQIFFKFAHLFSVQIGSDYSLMVFKSVGLLILGFTVVSSYSRFPVQGRLEKLMLIFWNPISILLISSQSDLAFLGSLIAFWMFFLREESTEDIKGALTSIAVLTFWPLALIGIRKQDITLKFGAVFLGTAFIFVLLFGGFWGMVSFFGENIRFSDFWFSQESTISYSVVFGVIGLAAVFSKMGNFTFQESVFLLLSSYFIVFTDVSGIAWASTMMFLVMRDNIDELKTAIFSLIGLIPIITRLL